MIAAGGSHTVVISADGRVLALGNNTEGQCDVNSQNTAIRILDGLWHDVNGGVITVNDGKAPKCTPPLEFYNFNPEINTFSLNENGVVLNAIYSSLSDSITWSDGDVWKRLPNRRPAVLPKLPDGSRYVAAAAGQAHTVLLRSDGAASACGRDGKMSDLSQYDCGAKYVAVAAGDAHTVLLRDDGQVIIAGVDSSGQCGKPEVLVQAQSPYVSIAAGHWHTVLIRRDGEAIAFGANEFGQCNLSPPTKGSRYVSAACGEAHTVLLQDDGNAFIFGGDQGEQSQLPALPPNRKYVQAACGVRHTVLLRDDGYVITCGDSACAIEAQDVIAVAAGNYHSAALRRDGRLFFAGHNHCDQIPPGSEFGIETYAAK
jgi:alpha-tubulin suppressor-like RCC1 family protein